MVSLPSEELRSWVQNQNELVSNGTVITSDRLGGFSCLCAAKCVLCGWLCAGTARSAPRSPTLRRADAGSCWSRSAVPYLERQGADPVPTGFPPLKVEKTPLFLSILVSQQAEQ